VRAWLHEKGVELEERDFFQDRLSEDELRQLLQGQRPSEVFSWSSPSFKALGLAADGLDDQVLLQLMLQEPRLIRRPLVKVGERLIIGGAQKTLDEAFP
jgi:arsenate reductase-like glutaredoxin family protein